MKTLISVSNKRNYLRVLPNYLKDMLSIKHLICLVFITIVCFGLLCSCDSAPTAEPPQPVTNSIPATAPIIQDDIMMPSTVQTMTVSYSSDNEVKEEYLASKEQIDALNDLLKNIPLIKLSSEDLLCFSKVQDNGNANFSVCFDSGTWLCFYSEGVITQFSDDLSKVSGSYFVSQDTMYQIKKNLIPDFEKDYITIDDRGESQSESTIKYTPVEDVNVNQIQEVSFYLPWERDVYKVSDGFIALRLVSEKENNFLRAVKYDEQGNFVWVQNYTEITSKPYFVTKLLIPTSDGGFVFVLDSDVDFGSDNEVNISLGHFVKCDRDGNIIWHNVLEFEGEGQILKLFETPNEDILTVGCCEVEEGAFAEISKDFAVYDATSDIVLMKYDKNGKRIKLRFFGGSDFESLNSTGYTPGVGLVIGGYTQSCDGDITKRKEKGSALSPRDFIVTFDEDLNEKWQYVFEGENKIDFSSVDVSGDSIYVAGSFDYETENSNKSVVFKFDANGEIITSVTIDGNIIWNDYKSIISIANNNKILIPVETGQIYQMDQNLKTVKVFENVIVKEASEQNYYGFHVTLTDDGGFFTVQEYFVKYLPQPPWMSSIMTDSVMILSRYNVNGEMLYRKTYDKSSYTETKDVVIPLPDGRVILDKG